MEAVPLSGSLFVYLKLFLLVKAIGFSRSHFVYWKPFFFFEGVFPFSGEYSFKMETITFSRNF